MGSRSGYHGRTFIREKSGDGVVFPGRSYVGEWDPKNVDVNPSKPW